MLSVWRCFALTLFVSLLVGCGHRQPVEKPVPSVQGKPAPVLPPSATPQTVRGVWLTTLAGLDWPTPASSDIPSDARRISVQQKALTDKLDNLVSAGVNTIFFQVKPDGTALYRSALLPWSDVLTGEVGKDPGYDPLAFLLTEAHKRGLKVHAWLNPYRVSSNTQAKTAAALKRTLSLSPSSVYALHPEWIRTASDRFVLDPGIPEVRDWIVSVVVELVAHYDVDGIHFDDYFYYETPNSRLADDATYRKYGQEFAIKGDWRRHNTLLLIQRVSAAIKSAKPQVEFGVSPAGIWRNAENDPRGSDTRGGAAYDISYADTRLWVEQGLLDYIVPQIYWSFGRKIARYDTLAKWWADVVRPTKTRLYIGVALYRVGESSSKEPEWAQDGGVPELKRQLALNASLPEIKGTVLFREAFFNQPQTVQAVQYLRTQWREPSAPLLLTPR